ncbi:MAG TPA: acyltransferase family protein [Phycicoccus sp.]|jgi:peptidoglycan/LPS O-acetylase OafA/YrhL/lysophospholipase L1-like esterase|nr:acyltransferase family protein [Phycicoccus sp.]
MLPATRRPQTRPARVPGTRSPLGRAGLRPEALEREHTPDLDIERGPWPAGRPAAAPNAKATRPREASTRHTQSSKPSAHLPGLDGLRALAVIAVIAFHLNPTWLPGGFLGVDIFFVISGFLITTLLVREVRWNGRLDLPGFWTRRARRLLPALALCVLVSTLIARLVESDLLVGIGRQTLGAATFSTNWLEIAHGSDYFHATTPQLFMNLWSLAVEEQFYLLWPFAALALLRLAHAPRVRMAIPLAVGLASAALMAGLLDPTAATRVYYGTDTHLIGLMLGAALAFAYAAPHRAWTASARWARLRWPVTAWAAVVLLTLLVICDESSPWTFRLGIPLASLATAVLMLSVVSTPSMARTALEVRPLAWIGQRSYGLYLWHWPVILIVGQLWPVEPGGSAYLWSRVLCVGVTVAAAEASYRWVETPIRRHGFRGTGRRVMDWWERLSTGRSRVVAATVVATLLAYAVALSTAPAATSTELTLKAQAGAGAEGAAPDQSAGSADAEKAEPSPAPTVAAAPLTDAEKAAVFAMPTGSEIDAFGDSILVGSIPAMKYYFDGIRMDAQSNRHWSDGLAAIKARGSDVRRAVVLSFGTNAGTDPAAVEAILTALGPKRMVVILTEHGRFSRIAEDNAALVTIAAAHPNVAIADWHGALEGTSGQLQPDGIHPSRIGQHLYAKTIRAAFAELTTRHTGTTPVLPELPIP